MVRHASPDPECLGALVTVAEALTAGLTRDQVRQRVRGSRWIALGGGRYLRTGSLPDVHRDREALRHAYAAVARATAIPASVVSGRSAAVAHGLPLLGGPPARAELTVPSGLWSGTRRDVRVRVAELEPVDLMPASALLPHLPLWATSVPITSVARTWVDSARLGGVQQAMVIGDAALRADLVTADELAKALDRAGAVRGHAHAALALPHVGVLRENPLESASFGWFLAWGIPLPTMQVVIHDERGFVGRLDFCWDDQRVIGEADGAGKYEGRGVLIAEKLREDRLRRLGFIVVRWTWDELIHEPWVVRERLLGALALAA